MTNERGGVDSRRRFLGTAAGAGAALALAGNAFAGRAPTRTATSRVTIGQSGVTASFLAQGTGYNGGARTSDHTRMGVQAFDRLLRHGLERGVTFLDMADLYGTHDYVRRTVKGLPRERLTLLTKIWPRREYWTTPSANCRDEIDRFRKELKVDTLDVCLLHCMLNANWTKDYASMRDGLSELKSEGVVGALGVSCHDHGALKVAAEDPWVDVIFARINHKGGKEYSCDDTAEAIATTLRTARKNGKFVVGMKIFGAGKLTRPADKDASLQYVLGNDLVDAMTIGMLDTKQVDDTVKRIDKTLRKLG